MRVGLLLALVALTGCAGRREVKPVNAPTPFSAAEIRAATAPGRTYRFRIEAAGQPPFLRTMRFTAVDGAGATLVGEAHDLGGRPLGSPTRNPVTWDDLVGHATYPADATSIQETEVEVPAGRFEALLYTVETEEGTTRAWFAEALPGAPVRHEELRGGEVVSRMVLVEHLPGGTDGD